MLAKTLLALCLVSIIGFTSCSKNKDDVQAPTFPIEGTWMGKYSVLSGPYNNYYSFNIKAGGVIERLDINGVKTGQGTWKMSGTTFEAVYTQGGETFSVLATFDNKSGELDGTWGSGVLGYGGGYWYMEWTTK